jgi:hypothetical protein
MMVRTTSSREHLAKAVQQYVILEKSGNKNARKLLKKIEEFVN